MLKDKTQIELKITFFEKKSSHRVLFILQERNLQMFFRIC